MDLSASFTYVLALSTLLGNIFTVLLILSAVIARPVYRKVMRSLGDYAMPLGFVLTLGATVGSLVYSEVVGYAACILCWTQRIFMYPQMFLFGMAAWRSDRGFAPYGLMLSLVGGAVALYNWVKDMLALYTHIALACPVVPGLPSCDRIYVNEFGYITIPMLSLNIFVLVGIVMYASLKKEKFADA